MMTSGEIIWNARSPIIARLRLRNWKRDSA